MKFVRLFFYASMLVCCCLSQSVHAAAFGVYLDGSLGSGSSKWENSSSFDADTESFGAGFALDTAPVGEKLFNYRLNAGYNMQNHTDKSDTTLKLKGGSVENIFGFSIARQPDFRWWLGPLLRLGYYTGNTEYGWTKLKIFEYGAGAATGINVKLNDHVIVAPSIGVRFTGEVGNGEWSNRLTGHFTTGFANLAILFQ